MITPWGYVTRFPGYMPPHEHQPLPMFPHSLLYPWQCNTGPGMPPWMTYPMMPPNQRYYHVKAPQSRDQVEDDNPWVQAYHDMALLIESGIFSDSNS